MTYCLSYAYGPLSPRISTNLLSGPKTIVNTRSLGVSSVCLKLLKMLGQSPRHIPPGSPPIRSPSITTVYGLSVLSAVLRVYEVSGQLNLYCSSSFFAALGVKSQIQCMSIRICQHPNK